MKLKIISLNLWSGGKLLPAIENFLQSENADIVLLQEVYGETVEPVMREQNTISKLKKLGYTYSSFRQALTLRLPEGDIPSGNAVLSKYEICDSSFSLMTDSDRPYYEDIPEDWPFFPRILQHVTIKSPAGNLNVFNLHGVWDLDGDNVSPQRQQMRDVILRDTAGLSNVIVAGDSNAKFTNPVMRDLEAQLSNVFGDELVSTFNMRRKDNPGYATAAVDVMYVSKDIKIIAKDCPNVDISDHLPLVVTLELY